VVAGLPQRGKHADCSLRREGITESREDIVFWICDVNC
jgi:hypothetical protein